MGAGKNVARASRCARRSAAQGGSVGGGHEVAIDEGAEAVGMGEKKRDQGGARGSGDPPHTKNVEMNLDTAR